VKLIIVLAAFSLLVAGASAAPPAGLPAGWRQVSAGPDGGVVYQGRIVNQFARWDGRPSAVYLPPHYDPHSQYPVVYLLAGMRGSPSSYWGGLHFATVADQLIASGQMPPFIAAIPAAGPIVHPDTGEWAGIWEDYLVRNVVPWIDSHLATIPTPAGRALEGLCAGGFGAVDIGLRHPGLFDTLGSWEGYFAPVFRDGPFVNATTLDLAAHNPSVLVRNDAGTLRASGVRFYISAGGNHGAVLRAWSLQFASELERLHLSHELWLLPATERGHFWAATMPSALLYAGSGFTSTATVAAPGSHGAAGTA
jgi:enterochelin esterase-like enzyme